MLALRNTDEQSNVLALRDTMEQSEALALHCVTEHEDSELGMFVAHDTPFRSTFTEETREKVLLPTGFCKEVERQVLSDRHPNTRSHTHNSMLHHMGVDTTLQHDGIFLLEDGDGDDDETEELGYGLGEMVTVSGGDDEDEDGELQEYDEFGQQQGGILIPSNQGYVSRSPSPYDWDGDRPDSYS
jgi:hypothetical protein